MSGEVAYYSDYKFNVQHTLTRQKYDKFKYGFGGKQKGDNPLAISFVFVIWYKNDLSFIKLFAGNTQFFPSLCTAVCKYLPAVLCGHARPESVFVNSFPSRWLKCPFHSIFIFWECKSSLIFLLCKLFTAKYSDFVPDAGCRP